MSKQLLEIPEMPLHEQEIAILDQFQTRRAESFGLEISSLDAAVHMIDSIVDSESLSTLARTFGADIDAEMPADEKIKLLKTTSNEKWDFRSGRERQDTGTVELTPEQEAAVFAVTDELGMRGETNASKKQYDFITVLGGANQSNLLRIKHMAKQLEEGVTSPYIVLLGSDRKVSEAERANTVNYAQDPQTEFDLLNSALESEFGVTQFDEGVIDMRSPGHSGSDPKSWKIRIYTLPDGTEVLSVSAPQEEGDSRVNTADTYRFMQEVIGSELLDGKDILNVTTDLYVPFQKPDAIRLLGLKCKAKIETIGYGGVDRPASSYLQEINSAINQTALLSEAMKDTLDARFRTLGMLARFEERNEHNMTEYAAINAKLNGSPETYSEDKVTGVKNVTTMFGAEDSKRNKEQLIDTAIKIEQIRAIITGTEEREV